MRAFIDGVLRFGIPPKFYIGVIKPGKGNEKVLLNKLNETFEDPTMKGMYGSKEDAMDTEDFFSFVSIPLTSPLFLQWLDIINACYLLKYKQNISILAWMVVSYREKKLFLIWFDIN